MTTMPDESTAPLAHLRVLDLTRLLPGGYATQMLADLGADVLKIEEPGVGDYARTMAPYVKGTDGVGVEFFALNRNKRSAAINLKHPAGREALLRLVVQADVLVESYRPGVMDRLGLGHEALRAANPRLVICAISGYGQTGPYRLRAGHDLNYIGYAGLLAHLTTPGQPPTLPGAQFADVAGGALMAVAGILAALVGRSISGEGRVVDVSMTDGALAMLPILAGQVLTGDDEPEPGAAMLDGSLPCYNVYETADGRFLTVGALEPKFWQSLCERLDRPDLIAHQVPTDAADRQRTIDELAAIFHTRPLREWLELLAGDDMCVGPVNTLREALDDAQIQARGVTAARDDQGEALRLMPVMSGVLFSGRGRAPALGAHTGEALASVGFMPEEIAALAESGAIALGPIPDL